MHNGNKSYSLIMNIMNRKGVLQILFLVTKFENIMEWNVYLIYKFPEQMLRLVCDKFAQNAL